MKLRRILFQNLGLRFYSSQPQWAYTKLTHRSIFRLRGEDSLKFLQGLVTNDTGYLSASMANHQPALYSMMLNTQGRLLYDLMMYVKPEINDDVYMECDRSVMPDVIQKMVFYRLRRKLEIQSMEKEMNVYTVFPKNHSDCSTAQVVADGAYILCCDPRVSQLGFRAILEDDKDPSKVFPAEEVNEDEYHKFRYSLGVAEGCGDLPPGAAFPLEANGDYMNGVSFHKGCYIGQELTARTHHTGVVRKRLMPLRFDVDASNLRINAKIVDEKGNNLGKFRRAIQTYGLGLLYVHAALAAKSMLVQNEEGDGISCRTEKPGWWDRDAKMEGEIRGFHADTADAKG